MSVKAKSHDFFWQEDEFKNFRMESLYDAVRFSTRTSLFMTFKCHRYFTSPISNSLYALDGFELGYAADLFQAAQFAGE